MVTNTKRRQEFRYIAGKFIRAVIHHRRLLITTGKSTTNEMRSRKIMSHLETQINAVNFTNKGMAKLFLANADDIRSLIKHDDVLKHNDFNWMKQLSLTHQYL